MHERIYTLFAFIFIRLLTLSFFQHENLSNFQDISYFIGGFPRKLTLYSKCRPPSEFSFSVCYILVYFSSKFDLLCGKLHGLIRAFDLDSRAFNIAAPFNHSKTFITST